MIIGVLGGIGAGKSTVVAMLKRFGAETIDADALAHEALESHDVRGELVSWLGTAVLDRDGRVDRRAVGERVFSDPARLERLEALVHPVVRGKITRRLEEFRRARGREGAGSGGIASGILVLDVPLLSSTPLLEECDALLFIDADLEIRRERVERTRGWSAGEIEKRERHQTPVEEKRRMADFVIDNSRAESETLRQVEECLEELRQRAGGAARSRDEEKHEQGGH